jgi:hypothetical protein
MKGDVSIEHLEEWNAVTDQNRQDRIAHFVGQPKAKALRADHAASNKPDGTEVWSQAPIHELREIA